MTTEKWSDGETDALMAYWREHVDVYRNGPKKRFYEGVAAALGRKNSVSVKNRCEFLERKYGKLKAKHLAAGFNSQCTDAPSPVRAVATKELKWYFIMDQVLGGDKAHEAKGIPSTTAAKGNPLTAPVKIHRPVGVTHRSTAVGVSTPPRALRQVPIYSLQPEDLVSVPPAAPVMSNASILSDFHTYDFVDRSLSGIVTPPPITSARVVPTNTSSLVTTANDSAESRKRKQPEPSSIAEILTGFGKEMLQLGRAGLELMQRKLEDETLLRREEMQQRRREFQMNYELKRAQYELDKAKWEMKQRMRGQ